jgi:hypothetical protein
MTGHAVCGGAGSCCGAGDVGGVLLGNGLSENVSDEGLDAGVDDGREWRVLLGEPSGVKKAGRSVAVIVHMNRPC